MHRVGLPKTCKGEVGECKVYLDYLKRLNTLTSGSKPLITSLTLSAQAQHFASESIVRAIEDRLHQVEPSLKLPLLYLIDSVIKNNGGVYIEGFKANILNVFLEAYKKVQADQREKFERVLSTWINSKIFPSFILDRITDAISDLKEQESAPSRSTQVHVNPKFVAKGDKHDSDLLSMNKPAIGDKRHHPSAEDSDRHRGFVRVSIHFPLF
ncbi:mRNA 3' end processing factor [Entomophthora muscae]|uniref:mRNA 3' end processing factor n=1 Tax=Entomophthora muscae TaxID=34485 RepID=A0ACC2RNX2_9FUNG|nr:mRNA 3' end processing factor [Entomophthora muscae]